MNDKYVYNSILENLEDDNKDLNRILSIRAIEQQFYQILNNNKDSKDLKVIEQSFSNNSTKFWMIIILIIVE